MRLRLVILLPVLFACGCAVGPDYERPEIDAPADYLQTIDEGRSIANLAWWALFQDAELQALITFALEQNKDLAIAAARVEEARAQYGFVRADLYPQVNGQASASRGDVAPLILPGAGIGETYVLAANLSWEIDLFGKLRRSNQAARAELLSTEQAKNAVIITLVADVASAYLLLRDLDARQEIARQRQQARLDALRIIQARFDQGTVPLLDVNQAEIEEVNAAVVIASIERQTIQTENLISILLGRNPSPITRGLGLEDQVFPADVPAGLPSELLQRRPDILAAEQQLAAQTARIGVAQALRWPSFTLTGQLGVGSNDLSDLNSSDSKIWNIGGDLLLPIFTAGKNKRRVEVERARTEQALRQYELAILQALREVDDSLAAIRTYRQEAADRQRQVTAARSARRLAWARYTGGVSSYLEVLETDRALFTAELAASETYRLQLVSIVQLYRALGGGWDNGGTTLVITSVPGSAPVSAPAGGTPQDSGATP
jgi:multidrug efflux system outer membrane protein